MDMWNAGAVELAVLLCIFSGVWPYSKQLMSFFLWFAPPSIVSVSRRGSIFHWLDVLAKWSMADIFVFIMSLVGFWVSINSPDLYFLPENLYSINLMVIPTWGIYANLIAQLVSQLSSHVIIHYHRKVASKGLVDIEQNRAYDSIARALTSESDASFGEENQNLQCNFPDSSEHSSEQLKSHIFRLRGENEGCLVAVNPRMSPALAFVCLSTVTLVILGSVLPSFQVELLGIVGVLAEMGQGFEEAIIDHSLFSIIGLLLDQARFLQSVKYYIGLASMAVVIILTCFVVPLMQIILVLWLWFGSLTAKLRQRILVGIELLQAWQYVEVYIISVVIATWQFGSVSSFMVNEYCNALSDTLGALNYYGILKEEDAQCFYVQSRLKVAIYLLIVAALLLWLSTRFVTKAAAQKAKDDETAQNEKIADGNQDIWLADKEMSFYDEKNSDYIKSTVEKIRPLSLMFTDEFSVFLTTVTAVKLPPSSPGSNTARTMPFSDAEEKHCEIECSISINTNNDTFISDVGGEDTPVETGVPAHLSSDPEFDG